MSITDHGDGGFSIVGKESINLYRMLVLKGALKLELKGLRMSRQSAYAMVKREFGLKGNKQSVYDQFCALVEQVGAEHSRLQAEGKI